MKVLSNSTGTQTLSGAISGPGTLVKDGSGTLILAAVNTYTGTTTINSGTVATNQNLGAANSNAVVNSGATLSMTGAITTPGW